MHPHPIWELLPIQSAHAHWLDWERAKHRADFFSTIGFPNSHPLRVALRQASRDLEQHRWAADVTITDLAREHGAFSAQVNGYHFEKAADWFRSADGYSDCPKIRIGKHVRRSNYLFLAGVASIHDVERSGRAFAESVTKTSSREYSRRRKTNSSVPKSCSTRVAGGWSALCGRSRFAHETARKCSCASSARGCLLLSRLRFLTSSCEPPASPAAIPECIARSDTESLAPRQRVPLDHLLEEVPSCLPGAPLPQPTGSTTGSTTGTRPGAGAPTRPLAALCCS